MKLPGQWQCCACGEDVAGADVEEHILRRHMTEKTAPEGPSPLRSAYALWRLKERLAKLFGLR